MSKDPIQDALKIIPYGFYALTSGSGLDNNAMVVNWVTQVSFKPRLVAIGLQKKSYSHGLISKGGTFVINMFRKEDKDFMMPFTKGREKNPDKMKKANFTKAPITGCPVLEGASAYLECRLVDMIDVGGDHDILVGKTVGAEILNDMEANDTMTLAHLGWSYAG